MSIKIRNIQNDFSEFLGFLGNIKIKDNGILPKVLEIELKKENFNTLSFQPHYRNISKVEILIMFFYKTNLYHNADVDLYNDYIEQINIKVKIQLKNNKRKFFVFRLDTHNPNHVSLYPHPKWHVQINDRNLDELDRSQYGNLIFMDTPRFFLFPIDVIVITDFILHNFLPKQRKELLRNNRKYREILKKYQKHFWKPFFEKIFSYLNDGNCEEEAKKFLPSLI